MFINNNIVTCKINSPNNRCKLKLINVKLCNDYINAISYIDSFLEELFDDFRSKNLLENTLFAILGDHGVSCGEHHAWLIPEIPYETQFKIPMMFYTENKEWKKRFPDKTVFQQWHTIDLMPTILDGLRFNGTYEEFNDEYLYEGQSVLRKDYKTKVQFGYVSPGFHSLVLREGHMKVVIPVAGRVSEAVFDLKNDEDEHNKLTFDKVPMDFKNWIKEMKNKTKIFLYHIKKWYK